MMINNINGLHVVCYHAQEDEMTQKELLMHLSVLQRQGLIASWYDRVIESKKEVEQDVLAQLDTADIILLLISQYFMASDFCYSTEMNLALELNESGKAQVLLVALDSDTWENTPFRNLEILPSNGKAIHTWPNIDEAFYRIAKSLSGIIKKHIETKQWQDQGGELYIQKRYEEALAAYEHAIQLAPNLAIAYNGRGSVQFELKQYKEALVSFEQALHLDSTLVAAYINKGDVLNEFERYEEALAAYEQALHLDPTSGIGFIRKGNILYTLKRYEEALAIFRQAGEREEEAKTLASLGRVLRIQGKKVEARQYLEQALAIFKDSGEHLHEGRMLKLLGEISYEMGMNGDAQQHFDQALIIFGQEKDLAGEGETLNNLGLLYMALGRIEDAEKSLTQALAVHKGIRNREMEGVTLSNLGGVYKIRGNEQEALKSSNEARNIHSEIGNPGGEGVALNNLGVIENDLGDGANALKYYKDAYFTLKNAGKRWEAGRVLCNIGALHLKQPKHNAVVLACLLLARDMFEEAQSPDLTLAVAMMDHFAQGIGKKAYNRLLAICEQNAQQIVEQALHDV